MIFSDEQIKNNLKGVSGTKQNGIDFSIMDFGLIEGEIISINANNNSCKFKIFEHDKILNGFLVFPLDTNRFTLRNGQYYPNYKCGIYIIQSNDIDNYFIIPKDIYQNGNIDDETIKDILKKINENLNNKIIEINNTINNIKGNKIISVDTIPTSGIFKEGDLALIKTTGDIYQYQNNDWVFQANIKGSGNVTQQDILDAIAETNIDAKTLNGKEDTEFATSTQGTKADNAVPKSTTVNDKQLNSNITINKIDVGLGNVDNTSDADKPISTVTQNALNNKLNVSQKGSNNGLAELDINGKVPSTQLPSYVDDVLEYSSLSNFPTTGETGKIYLAIDTNKIYRWSGTTYIIISETITLGETNSTAYRGDRGKIAYDHSQLTSGNPHNVTKVNVGLGNVDNTSDINKPVSTATTTALNAKVDKTIKINNKPLSSDVTLLVSDITSAVDLTTAQILQNKTIKNSILDEEIYAQNSQFIIEREKEGIPEPNGWHEPKPFLYTTENTGLGSDVILKYLKDPIDNQDAVNKQYLINKLNNIELQSNSISDLNNAIETGFYNCYSAENAPSDGFYTIEVNTDGANVIQTATNANGEMYTRIGYDVQNNPSWGAWKTSSVDSASEILTKLKTVDGINSGLDSEYLGGQKYDKYASKIQTLTKKFSELQTGDVVLNYTLLPGYQTYLNQLGQQDETIWFSSGSQNYIFLYKDGIDIGQDLYLPDSIIGFEGGASYALLDQVISFEVQLSPPQDLSDVKNELLIKTVNGTNDYGSNIIDNIYDIRRSGFYYVRPNTNNSYPSWLPNSQWLSVYAIADEANVSMIIRESNELTHSQLNIANQTFSSPIFVPRIISYSNGFRVFIDNTPVYSACWGSVDLTTTGSNETASTTVNYPFTFSGARTSFGSASTGSALQAAGSTQSTGASSVTVTLQRTNAGTSPVRWLVIGV